MSITESLRYFYTEIVFLLDKSKVDGNVCLRRGVQYTTSPPPVLQGENMRVLFVRLMILFMIVLIYGNQEEAGSPKKMQQLHFFVLLRHFLLCLYIISISSVIRVFVPLVPFFTRETKHITYPCYIYLQKLLHTF